jgi:ABC-2 type transport system permease protein
MNTWVLLAETWVFVKGLPKRKDLLFWLILFPLVLMFLINFIFAPREQFISFKVGVIDEDEGSLSRTIINVMNETGVLNPVVIKDGGDLRELLRRGEYPLIIVIPRGFSDNITLATQAQIEV